MILPYGLNFVCNMLTSRTEVTMMKLHQSNYCSETGLVCRDKEEKGNLTRWEKRSGMLELLFWIYCMLLGFIVFNRNILVFSTIASNRKRPTSKSVPFTYILL